MNHPSDVQSALEKPLPADFVQSMAMRFGDHFSTALAVRAHHGRDESAYDPMPPDAVVFVTSTDDSP